MSISNTNTRRHDLAGKKFGRLTVISYHGSVQGKARWLCQCDCGTSKVIRGRSLTEGSSTSCGCLLKEKLTRHGRQGTPEYWAWAHAKDRCYNPRCQGFQAYGGTGITMCERWRESFISFFEDMGLRPTSQHSLDRYPNKHGNYEPNNCRWATKKEQGQNTRANINVTIDGETHCVAEWVRIKSLEAMNVYSRIRRGMAPVEALTRPYRKRRKSITALIIT